MEQTTKVFSFGFVALAIFFFTSIYVQADTIYVSDSESNTVMKFDSSGSGTVFASNLNNPTALAFDNSGNLYVANSGDSTILKFDSYGNKSVFAYSGLNSPSGLAFDNSGNLYALNSGDGTIEKFDSSGNGTFFANASILSQHITFDSSGNLYAAVWHNNEIFKYSTNGTESIFASTSPPNSVGPSGLAFDNNGYLFASTFSVIFSSPTILKFDTNGDGTVFASSGLSSPRGVAFDSVGNLYAANFGNGTIEEFDTNGNATVFASGLFKPYGIAIQVGDRIPTSWRQQYFGGNGVTTNNQSCAICDMDGTGQRNLFKYVAGLDPTNPASVFTLCVGGLPNQPAQMNLIFQPVVTGRTYTVQSSCDMINSGWWTLTNCTCPVTNGIQVTICDTNAVGLQRFYRIDISLP